MNRNFISRMMAMLLVLCMTLSMVMVVSAEETAAEADVTLSVSVSRSGSLVTAIVSMTEPKTPISALQFDLEYDNIQLTVASVTPHTEDSTAVDQDGYVSYMYTPADEADVLTEACQLLTVTFELAPTAEGNYEFGLSNAVAGNDEGNTVTELVVKTDVSDYSATWKSASTTLGGDIGVNFYVELSDDVVNNPDTFVQFTFAGKVVNVPMAKAVASESNGAVRYRFTCPVTSKNMTDEITAQVFCGDIAVGVSAKTTVDYYCNWIIANSSDTKTVNLMKAMLNYGAAAQNLFDYKTDDLANAELSEADKALPDGVKEAAAPYAHSKTGSEEGIELKSASLLLETTTTCRVYFEIDEGKSVEDFTFLINGVEVTPVADNDTGRYYVDTQGISANNLDQFQTITVGGLTLRYCGLSYVNQVMINQTSGETFDMARALYAYSQAAEAYIAK